MAIKESALSLITSITQSDLVRTVTSSGASRRITVANLAKAIVESYTGSSLGGSNQSVKDAIDSLNSKNSETITLDSSATAGSNESYCYNTGKVTTVFLDFTPNSSGTLLDIAMLPEGFRPRKNLRMGLTPVDQSSPMGTAYIVFYASGYVSVYMASAKRCFVLATYSTD